MFSVVLFEPEIPQNTGNIIRLCANTGADLHLVGPLGFALDDRKMRRSGLDYHEYASITLHENFASVRHRLSGRPFFALTTKAQARPDETALHNGVFVFGPESRGLPESVLQEFPAAHRLRLPMQPQSRSLNLSNAVAVVVYEAWRQNGFSGSL